MWPPRTPGAFFQSPVEASSGSDTTDVSTSVGVSSGGEGIEGEHCGKRDSGGVIMDATTTSCLTKRRFGLYEYFVWLLFLL